MNKMDHSFASNCHSPPYVITQYLDQYLFSIRSKKLQKFLKDFQQKVNFRI